MGLQGLPGQHQRVQIIRNDHKVIELDVSVSERHQRDSPASELPIESGDIISDNILIRPFVLEIDGIISDTPLSLVQALLTTTVAANFGTAGVIALGAGQALASIISQSKSPSVQAFEQILQLQDDRKPFDVITTLKTYTNMFVKQIMVPRDAQKGRSLNFTLQLVQLVLVTPQTVNIAVLGNSDLSAGEANQGQSELSSRFLKGVTAGNVAGTAAETNTLGALAR